MLLTRGNYRMGSRPTSLIVAVMLLMNMGCATVMGSWDYGLPKDNLSTEDRLWHIVFPLSVAAADQCVFKREDTYGFFLEDATGEGNSDQTTPSHVRVRYVHAKLPAGKAGMAIGDHIIALNGDAVTS
ncbi:MAG TPA: PDZ domain-containing protein, partial [Nitrospira sp.]|nr:PDZ domain-containing protein [Nitrospira sp.]